MTSRQLTAKYLSPGQQPVTDIWLHKRKVEPINAAFAKSMARINEQAKRLK
jgi:hypothetical protein